mgnify:CR=1 FL=1
MADNRMQLNSRMEMDHVIQVHPDGSVTDAPRDVHGPEVTVETDGDGQYVGTRDDHGKLTWNVHVDGDDWTLLKGWAIEDGSELLHRSQFVGGALAEAILETPGYYVATEVSDGSGDAEADSWCVAFKEADQ